MLKIRQPQRNSGFFSSRPSAGPKAHELVVDADVKEYPCTLQVQIDANRKLEKVTVMEKSKDLKAAFVDDVTVPDGTKMEPSEVCVSFVCYFLNLTILQTFTKVFRVRNTGSEAWPTGTRMAFSANWPFSHERSILVQSAQPGQVIDVELSGLKAPSAEGNFVSLANMQDEKNRSFGDTFWISWV